MLLWRALRHPDEVAIHVVGDRDVHVLVLEQGVGDIAVGEQPDHPHVAVVDQDHAAGVLTDRGHGGGKIRVGADQQGGVVVDAQGGFNSRTGYW